MYLNVTQTWPNLQRHAVWSLKLTNQQIGEAHVLPFPLWDCHPLLSRFFSKSWIVQICHGGQKNVSCIRCHLGAFGATQQTLSLAMFCSCDAWSGIWILWEIASLPYGPMAMFHLHDCWSNSKRKDLETWNNWKKPVSRQYVSKIREAPGVTSVSNLKNSGGQSLTQNLSVVTGVSSSSRGGNSSSSMSCNPPLEVVKWKLLTLTHPEEREKCWNAQRISEFCSNQRQSLKDLSLSDCWHRMAPLWVSCAGLSCHVWNPTSRTFREPGKDPVPEPIAVLEDTQASVTGTVVRQGP